MIMILVLDQPSQQTYVNFEHTNSAMLISPNHIGRINAAYHKKSCILTKCLANRLSRSNMGHSSAWWSRHVGP